MNSSRAFPRSIHVPIRVTKAIFQKKKKRKPPLPLKIKKKSLWMLLKTNNNGG